MKRILFLVFPLIVSLFSVLNPAKNTFPVVTKKEAYSSLSKSSAELYDISFEDSQTPLKVTEATYDYDLDYKYGSGNVSKYDADIKYVISNPTDKDINTNVLLPVSSAISYFYGPEVNDESTKKTSHYVLPVEENDSYEIPSLTRPESDETYSLDMKLYYRVFQIKDNPEEKRIDPAMFLPEGMEMKDYAWIDFFLGEFQEYQLNGFKHVFHVLFVGEDRTKDFLSRVKLYTYSDSGEKNLFLLLLFLWFLMKVLNIPWRN